VSAPPPPPAGPAGEVAARLASAVDAAHLSVVVKLLGNVKREPGSEKFRRLRLANAKIQAAVVDTGALALLQAVGFAVREEGGERVAALDDATAALPAIDAALARLPQPPAPAPAAPALAAPPAAEAGAGGGAQLEAAVAEEFRRLVAQGVPPTEASAQAQANACAAGQEQQ